MNVNVVPFAAENIGKPNFRDCTYHYKKLFSRRIACLNNPYQPCWRSDGSLSQISCIANSWRPSRMKTWRFPSITWKPVTISSVLLFCCSLRQKRGGNKKNYEILTSFKKIKNTLVLETVEKIGTYVRRQGITERPDLSLNSEHRWLT